MCLICLWVILVIVVIVILIFCIFLGFMWCSILVVFSLFSDSSSMVVCCILVRGGVLVIGYLVFDDLCYMFGIGFYSFMCYV